MENIFIRHKNIKIYLWEIETFPIRWKIYLQDMKTFLASRKYIYRT